MSTLSSFTYGEIALTETVVIDDIPHITRLGIGEWLEYEHPRQSIAMILDRHPFIESYSSVINMITLDGKNRDVTVYNPMGFLLIVMKSGQPKANEMNQQIAAFVWHYLAPGSEKLSAKDKRGIASRITALVAQLPKIKDALVMRETWAEIAALCDKLGRPYPERVAARQGHPPNGAGSHGPWRVAVPPTRRLAPAALLGSRA